MISISFFFFLQKRLSSPTTFPLPPSPPTPPKNHFPETPHHTLPYPTPLLTMKRFVCKRLFTHTPKKTEQIDWGAVEAFDIKTEKVVEHKKGEKVSALYDDPKEGWGMVSPDPEYAELLPQAKKASGPTTLKLLCAAKNAPHPQEILEELEKTVRLVDAAFSILLIHCKSRIKMQGSTKEKLIEANKAQSLYIHGIKNRHHLGANSFSAMVACHCAAGKMVSAEKLIAKLGQGAYSAMVPLPQVYVAMIKGYTERNANLNTSRAWELFESLVTLFKESDSLRAGSIPQEAKEMMVMRCGAFLLRGAAYQKSEKEARELWEVVVTKWEMQPTLQMYTNYINALSSTGNVTDAIDAFSDMKTQGLKATAVTYTAMLKGLGEQREDTEIAEDLFAEMIDAGIRPNVFVHTAVLGVYRRADDVVGMKMAYRRMRKAQVVPNSFTYSVLLTTAGASARNPNDSFYRLIVGIWEKITKGLISHRLHRKFPREKLDDRSFFHHSGDRLEELQPRLVNNLLQTISSFKKPEPILEIVEELKRLQIVFTRRHFDSVCNALKAVHETELLDQLTAESDAKVFHDKTIGVVVFFDRGY